MMTRGVYYAVPEASVSAQTLTPPATPTGLTAGVSYRAALASAATAAITPAEYPIVYSRNLAGLYAKVPSTRKLTIAMTLLLRDPDSEFDRFIFNARQDNGAGEHRVEYNGNGASDNDANFRYVAKTLSNTTLRGFGASSNSGVRDPGWMGLMVTVDLDAAVQADRWRMTIKPTTGDVMTAAANSGAPGASELMDGAMAFYFSGNFGDLRTADLATTGVWVARAAVPHTDWSAIFDGAAGTAFKPGLGVSGAIAATAGTIEPDIFVTGPAEFWNRGVSKGVEGVVVPWSKWRDTAS